MNPQRKRKIELTRKQNLEILKFSKVHGAKSSSDFESANNWLEAVLSGCFRDYEEANMYNADETELFLQSHEDFESLVDSDNQLECYQEQSSDEIVHVVESEDENSREDAIIDPPTASEALQMIQNLRLFFIEDAELNELDFLEASVEKNRSFRQDKITDYFKNSRIVL